MKPPEDSHEDGVARDHPDRIQRMVDLKRLHEEPFERAEVVALWKKAVDSARDAGIPELSLDGALRAAYDAGHMACLALLAAHGLRVGRGQGHHEMAFAAAAALGGSELADLVPESEEIRGLRASSMYDPTLAEEPDRAFAVEWAMRTLPPIRAALVRRDGDLEALLAECP